MESILLGQFNYDAVKKLLQKSDLVFSIEADLTMIHCEFETPENITSPICQTGRKWVVCAKCDKTAVINALGYPDIQTVMDAIVGEGPYFNNLRSLTDCNFKIALGQGMNEYEAAGYALDKLSGYMLQAV
jgi:hypothetical protein